MYVVLVRFVIKSESVDAFREAVLRQAKNSLSREVTCRRFDVALDDHRPDHCLLYELYDDQAAFDLHLATDHFNQFNDETADLVVSKEVSCWRLADDETKSS